MAVAVARLSTSSTPPLTYRPRAGVPGCRAERLVSILFAALSNGILAVPRMAPASHVPLRLRSGVAWTQNKPRPWHLGSGLLRQGRLRHRVSAAPPLGSRVSHRLPLLLHKRFQACRDVGIPRLPRFGIGNPSRLIGQCANGRPPYQQLFTGPDPGIRHPISGSPWISSLASQRRGSSVSGLPHNEAFLFKLYPGMANADQSPLSRSLEPFAGSPRFRAVTFQLREGLMMQHRNDGIERWVGPAAGIRAMMQQAWLVSLLACHFLEHFLLRVTRYACSSFATAPAWVNKSLRLDAPAVA